MVANLNNKMHTKQIRCVRACRWTSWSEHLSVSNVLVKPCPAMFKAIDFSIVPIRTVCRLEFHRFESIMTSQYVGMALLNSRVGLLGNSFVVARRRPALWLPDSRLPCATNSNTVWWPSNGWFMFLWLDEFVEQFFEETTSIGFMELASAMVPKVFVSRRYRNICVPCVLRSACNCLHHVLSAVAGVTISVRNCGPYCKLCSLASSMQRLIYMHCMLSMRSCMACGVAMYSFRWWCSWMFCSNGMEIGIFSCQSLLCFVIRSCYGGMNILTFSDSFKFHLGGNWTWSFEWRNSCAIAFLPWFNSQGAPNTHWFPERTQWAQWKI